MATEPDIEPPTRAGAGLAERLRQGEGYERLYNAYATQLYQYCWTLVGADSASDAVHEAILAAVQLLDRLDDRSDLRSWLFALARSACQRRGLSSESPYVQLVTHPGQRPVVEMARRLPPSHSELLELYLRHSLAPSQIARIQGLDPEIISELCRAAVRRAADICAEYAPADDGGTAPRIWVNHTAVSGFLASLGPPEPPEDLRDRAIQGCADPARASEREAAGAAMAPLGADGFPLQRDRSGPSDESHGLSAAAATPPSEDTDPHAEDTTAGHVSVPAPARAEDPHVSEGGQRRGQRHGRRRSRRYRWPLPATSGLVTVGVALAFWGFALTSGSSPNEPAPSDPSEPSRPNSAASEGASEQFTGTASPEPAEPGHTGEGGAPAGAPEPQPPASGPEDEASASPDTPGTEPSASPEPSASLETAEEAESGDEEATSPEEGAEDADEADEDPGSEEDPFEPRGPISALFDELFAPDS